jgi:hypothetical protein
MVEVRQRRGSPPTDLPGHSEALTPVRQGNALEAPKTQEAVKRLAGRSGTDGVD